MKPSNSTSLVAGLIVASLGVLPLTLALMDLGSGAADPTSTTASTVATEPPTTLVEVEVDPPPLEGVDDRLSRVLYASGAAEGVQPGSTTELPEAIVKVLAYYDVTLSVPAGDQP